MDYDAKKVARSQYFKYFTVWFIIAAILLVLYAGLKIAKGDPVEVTRTNEKAPKERVYDYAQTLSESEKDYLRQVIAKQEERGTCDIVLLITNEEVGLDDDTWFRNMMNLSDDFYDEGAFGYDKPYGDGALLLYNWYEDERGSQKGEWLSTSGKMEYQIGYDEEDDILDELDRYIDTDPVKGYAAAIERIGYWGMVASSHVPLQVPIIGVIFLPIIVAAIFCAGKLHQSPGVDTTTPLTYVTGGNPQFTNRRDDFIRKSVTHVKIESSSGGHGGGSAGHHRSSGGHSHGGGGRRH